MLALPVVLAYGRAIVLAALAIEPRRSARERASPAMLPNSTICRTGRARCRCAPNRSCRRQRSACPMRAVLRACEAGLRCRAMPRALVVPGAVAISHNSLLRDVAQRETRASDSVTPRPFSMRRGATTGRHAMSEISRALARCDLGTASLDEPYRDRALQLVEAVAQSPSSARLRATWRRCVRQVLLLGEIWTGSGGLYAPRAIGIEVLRRGGRVRRFDHGTPREFVATAEMTDLLELSVSSEFTLADRGRGRNLPCERCARQLRDAT